MNALLSPNRLDQVNAARRNGAAAARSLELTAAARGARGNPSGDGTSRGATPRGPVRAVSREEHAAITQQMIDQAIAEGRHSETMRRYCDQCCQQVDSLYSVIPGTRRMICRPCAKKNGVKDA